MPKGYKKGVNISQNKKKGSEETVLKAHEILALVLKKLDDTSDENIWKMITQVLKSDDGVYYTSIEQIAGLVGLGNNKYRMWQAANEEKSEWVDRCLLINRSLQTTQALKDLQTSRNYQSMITRIRLYSEEYRKVLSGYNEEGKPEADIGKLNAILDGLLDTTKDAE